MYHRFNENKYPSTNIQIEIFKKQIEIIKKNNLSNSVICSSSGNIIKDCKDKSTIDIQSPYYLLCDAIINAPVM